MNLLDLFIKIGVDDQASNKISGISSKAISVLGGAANLAGKAVMGITTIATAATGAAITGIASLGMAAEQQYADYEQLVGGINKLFEDSAYAVRRNAQQAFETVGISANEYMETVTSFSATLIQDMGGDTQAAAEVADKAMRDMADNANTFGNDMQSVQAVYQALAKQNFQLLDNLRLPYKGTKEGMEDLIAHANELREANGEMADLSIDSFADMVEAIHLVQSELNITGTTEKEAASTITGSLNMTKAAWTNFVTMLGSDTDSIDIYIKQLMDSLQAVVSNIVPLIDRFVFQLSEALPQIVPPLLDMAVIVIGQVASMIPDLLPPLVDAVIQGLNLIVDALPQILPPLIDAIVQIIIAICQMLPQMTPALTDAAIQLFMGLVEALPTILVALLSAIGGIISAIFSKITGSKGEMTASASTWFTGLLDGASQIIPNFLSWVGSIPGQILGALGDLGGLLWNAGATIINGFLGGLQAAWDGVTGFIGGVAGWIAANKGPLDYDRKLLEPAGEAIMGGFNDSLRGKFGDVKKTVKDISGLLNVSGSMNFASSARSASGQAMIEIKDCIFNVREDEDINRIALAINNMVNRTNSGRLYA